VVDFYHLSSINQLGEHIMALTYTETRTIVKQETRQVTITAPDYWGCFSSCHASNLSIKKKAETVLSKVDGDVTKSQVINALVTFVRGWRRMCENPRHQKAGVSDTEVRECVYAFVDKVLGATGVHGVDYKHIRDLADENPWKQRGK
jgi:hypothetical protein